MLPEVISILSTSIDWEKYLIAAKQALGHNITTQLDSAKISYALNPLQALLVTLGSIKDDTTKSDEILKSPGSLLQHCFHGFLVVSEIDMLLSIMEESSLNVMSVETKIRSIRLSVISGTLDEWRSTIINSSSSSSDYNLRLFVNKCLLHFEKIGIGQVWQEYQKVHLPDTTFLLREK